MASHHMTPRMFLAKQIRRLREMTIDPKTGKKITPEGLAKAVYRSESLVKAWESGRRIPQPEDLEQLDEIFGTKGLLAEIGKKLVNASVPLEWFGRWLEVENQATAFWSFEPLLVPGLLQTEDYARMVLRAANHIADIEEMVGARMKRQQVLVKDDAPTLVALIDESVLRRMIGDAKVMHDQLLHLAEMAKRDNIFIQIIPLTARACAGLLSGFVIAKFDGGNDVAYVDNQLNGEVIEDTEALAGLQRMFDTARSDALSRQESIDLILKVAAQWKS